MFEENDLVRLHKSRADFIGVAIAIVFCLILIRLWYLQIYRGEQLYQYSIDNRLRREIVRAPRGMIFSRDSQLLVHNTPRFDVIITPQYLQRRNETLKILSEMISMDVEDINRILARHANQARYRPVTIKRNIPFEEVALIETENARIPGVSVTTFIAREYIDGEVGGHLLGYISEINENQLNRLRKRDNMNYRLGDFIGQAGIEEEFDQYLRGEDGHEFVEVDALGRMKRQIQAEDLFSGIQNVPARAGHNLRLTIDRDMQLTAFQKMVESERIGAAVALEVHTGQVLTMVSNPSFNPTKFSRGITREMWSELQNDPRRPMVDRTFREHYAPGSTFKTFAAIAALEEGLLDPHKEIFCPPTFRLGNRVYNDWKRSGHGNTDMIKSIRESVDVYYYKLATMLDIDVLAHYSREFGMGARSGIRLPREIPGLIPTKEWKRRQLGEEWQLGETLSCIIGQSYVLTTPLQLAMAYGAIANRGTVYRPYIVKEVFSNSGEIIKRFTPEVINELTLQEETYDVIKQGLYEVVNERTGTAWWSRGRGIRMAGKTGTSQVRSMTQTELFTRCIEFPYYDRHHGLFVGYAPAYEPEVVVSVVIEHGCSGSGSAAPIARDILTTYMKKYRPELYEKYYAEDRARDIELWRRSQEEQRRREEEQKEQERRREAEAQTEQDEIEGRPGGEVNND